MRTRIRLSGRKHLPRRCFRINRHLVDGEHQLELSILLRHYFKMFPPESRVKLRLFENKLSETVVFGTIRDLKQPQTAMLKKRAFFAPSCQLCVVSTTGDSKGMLLGSTDSWTLSLTEDLQQGLDRKGILMFQTADIRPLVWKVDVREDDYPVVYLDSEIPQASTWVRSDPVFVSCVLPAIIREIFENILENWEDQEEGSWMSDWITWARALVPGRELPSPADEDNREARNQWIDDLLWNFCHKHRMLDQLLQNFGQEG